MILGLNDRVDHFMQILNLYVFLSHCQINRVIKKCLHMKLSHFIPILSLLFATFSCIQENNLWLQFSSVQFSCSVMSTLCDPMNCSTPGLPVHHQLPNSPRLMSIEVSDAIQPSHPLSSPFLPAPTPSQHQSLFQ